METIAKYYFLIAQVIGLAVLGIIVAITALFLTGLLYRVIIKQFKKHTI